MALRRARGFADLTQQEIADRLQISLRSVQLYEHGDVDPPFGVVPRWLMACERPRADLIDLVDELCAPRDLNPEPAGVGNPQFMTAIAA